MFDIHPDIARASTPPPELYHDAGIHATARDRIFARSWQFVGDKDLARVPGEVVPFALLEGCLDEPLMLARDEDDRLRCLSNVCTHRGMIVVEHGGRMKSLRCPYHGRRFGLDGCLQHMPEFDGVEGFPSPADNLPERPVEALGPWYFTALESPEADFAAWIGPVRERVAWMPLEEFRFEPRRSREYLVRANWALYCENYLEGFHIPYVHASLAEALDYGAYRTELFAWGNLQLGIAKPGEQAFDLPPQSPDAGQRVAAYYFWLFPNLMLNFYPWGLSINVVKPLGPSLTKVAFLSYVWRPERLASGAGAELDRVEREDEAIVEAVQRGQQSRLYRGGRYSPAREQGVHQFHRLLATTLSGK